MDLTMMERVGDGWEKMEWSCSTGQSPQRAVVPVEEEEEEEEEEEVCWYVRVKNAVPYDLTNTILSSPVKRSFPPNSYLELFPYYFVLKMAELVVTK
jgi:hypothetical protein